MYIMNYQKIYEQFIENEKLKNHKKTKGISEFEVHHIIPTCIGGPDIKENKVVLTYKGHFFAHLLLCEMFPDSEGLSYAVKHMINFKRYSVSSKTYQRLREEGDKFNPMFDEEVKRRKSIEVLAYFQTEKGLKQAEIHGKRMKELWDLNGRVVFKNLIDSVTGANSAMKRPDMREKISEILTELYQTERGKEMAIEMSKRSTNWWNNTEEGKKEKIKTGNRTRGKKNPRCVSGTKAIHYKGRIICFSWDFKIFYVFNTVRQTEKYLGLKGLCISDCCNGKVTSSQGLFFFRYKPELFLKLYKRKKENDFIKCEIKINKRGAKWIKMKENILYGEEEFLKEEVIRLQKAKELSELRSKQSSGKNNYFYDKRLTGKNHSSKVKTNY